MMLIVMELKEGTLMIISNIYSKMKAFPMEASTFPQYFLSFKHLLDQRCQDFTAIYQKSQNIQIQSYLLRFYAGISVPRHIKLFEKQFCRKCHEFISLASKSLQIQALSIDNEQKRVSLASLLACKQSWNSPPQTQENIINNFNFSSLSEIKNGKIQKSISQNINRRQKDSKWILKRWRTNLLNTVSITYSHQNSGNSPTKLFCLIQFYFLDFAFCFGFCLRILSLHRTDKDLMQLLHVMVLDLRVYSVRFFSYFLRYCSHCFNPSELIFFER